MSCIGSIAGTRRRGSEGQLRRPPDFAGHAERSGDNAMTIRGKVVAFRPDSLAAYDLSVYRKPIRPNQATPTQSEAISGRNIR